MWIMKRQSVGGFLKVSRSSFCCSIHNSGKGKRSFPYGLIMVMCSSNQELQPLHVAAAEQQWQLCNITTAVLGQIDGNENNHVAYKWKPSPSSLRIMSRTVACCCRRQSFCYLRLPDRQYLHSFLFSCRVDSLLHSQGSTEGGIMLS